MPETLPPFPVDDVSLDAVEHALSGAWTVDPDGTQRLVGADYTLHQLLDFLSGYDPEQLVTITDHCDWNGICGEVVEYVGGPLYTRDSIIAALIVEVRRLREESR